MSHIPNMFRTITVDELTFPSAMKTNRELLAFADLMIRPPASQALEVFMGFDILQSLITFIVCAHVMIKKGRMRDVRIFTLRKSPYGTFIVPNAVWTLLAGVCTYLVSWAGFCAYIVFIQETDRPLAEWLFYIPFPW